MLEFFELEEWLSGRKRATRNRVGAKASRGFKSHLFRKIRRILCGILIICRSTNSAEFVGKLAPRIFERRRKKIVGKSHLFRR